MFGIFTALLNKELLAHKLRKIPDFGKTDAMEQVVLVDEHDNEVGLMEKQQAHLSGRLHRAFSVFLFNSRNELLLQQRAADKYHSAMLWTNTCCSHPRPGEATDDAAIRRLMEEMGMVSPPLKKAFSFVYKASLINGLIEHEFDHVFTCVSDDLPIPDETEVAAWKYISLPDLRKSMDSEPESYTAWFRLCMENWSEVLFERAH